VRSWPACWPALPPSGGTNATTPVIRRPRTWAVPPRFARALFLRDDLLAWGWLRRRLDLWLLLAVAAVHPGPSVLVALVGDDPAALARACAFCPLPGGARLARRGSAVFLAFRLRRGLQEPEAERWVRRRLRSFPRAGLGVAQTSRGHLSLTGALRRATSAAIVAAALASLRADKTARRRPRRTAPGLPAGSPSSVA